MRILIAGKQRSLRNALQGFLQTRPGYEVVGTVANREALFNEVKAKAPDLLLLDEDLTGLLLERVVIPLQQLDPCPEMIVIGNWSGSAKRYLDAGVTAYTIKSDPPKSILTAIEKIRLRSSSV